MNGKMKKIAVIALVLGVVSIAFLSSPILAYVNGTGNGDLLQTQERDRLRTHEQDCDCDMLQTQNRDRLRAQERDGNGDMLQIHDRECNCAMNMEQYRHQYGEKTRSLGN